MNDATPPRRNKTAAMDYEQQYIAQGKTVIIGLDEAGYGAWAGPVAVGAACLPITAPNIRERLHGVKDSKQMTPRQRDAAYDIVQDTALGFGIGHAEPAEIQQHGLSVALAMAYQRAYDACVKQLDKSVQVVLLDGVRTWKTFQPDDDITVSRINKGDTLSLSIAAASVLAKVWRDRYMLDVAAEHPAYAFERHKGYGTAAHRQAIERYGVLTHMHRLNYAPIQAALRKEE